MPYPLPDWRTAARSRCDHRRGKALVAPFVAAACVTGTMVIVFAAPSARAITRAFSGASVTRLTAPVGKVAGLRGGGCALY